MSLRRVINWEGSKAEGTIIGTIASEWYEIYNPNDSQSATWACDVDIGSTEVLRGVPVSVNNRDILYAEPGKPVTLQKTAGGSYSIVGLSKTIMGNTHITYVNFEDSIGEVVGEETVGITIRRLLYEELATCGGYGIVRYGALGRFDADGNFIELLD